jgi:hypothetical protein
LSPFLLGIDYRLAVSVKEAEVIPWMSLMLLSESERARMDIAAVNLACAAGLPAGPRETDARDCLKRLDEYAVIAREYTLCSSPQFAHKPGDYRHSLTYFRALCLRTIHNPLECREAAHGNTSESHTQITH